MYFLGGGCTTLLHLFVRHPILVLALGLAGFAAQVPANPGPGDRLGTNAMLSGMEHRYLADHPDMTVRFEEIKAYFDSLHLEATGEEIADFLRYTDPCTAAHTQDIMRDASLRREATFLLYLDAYGRNGPSAARKLFADSRLPARK